MKPVLHSQPDKSARIQALEVEIARLEKQLSEAETNLNVFIAQIRNQLAPQIEMLHVLVGRYKNLKQDKKAKRLEQKKKGKHYQAPPTFPVPQNGMENGTKTPQNADLKKLYKEAIVKVHPDKLNPEDAANAEKATALTVQLNELYETGDLEELKGLHALILSGSAFSHTISENAKTTDTEALLQYLLTKQDKLQNNLQEIFNSELYHVLQTYADPLTFIPELRKQLEERIVVFRKRTRKYKET